MKYTTKESHEDKIQDLINLDISKEISEPESQVNEELSISSTGDETSLDRSKIIVNNAFAYNVALNYARQ